MPKENLIIMGNSRDSRISVIIRTYNSARFVEGAIRSALNQTIASNSFEVIVVDDGSTDNTLEILGKFRKETRLIRSEHIGPAGAANLGIAESRGDFIILLDSDDQFDSLILEKLLQAINAGEADFAYCDYYEEEIEEEKKEIVSLKDNIFNSIAIGILFRKRIIQEAGGYDPDLLFPEYDLLIRLARKGCKGAYVPLPLFTYNRHRSSLTGEKEYVERGLRQLSDRYGEIRGIRKY